eukprot:5787559-Prymnesium_polylepis.1
MQHDGDFPHPDPLPPPDPHTGPRGLRAHDDRRSRRPLAAHHHHRRQLRRGVLRDAPPQGRGGQAQVQLVRRNRPRTERCAAARPRRRLKAPV